MWQGVVILRDTEEEKGVPHIREWKTGRVYPFQPRDIESPLEDLVPGMKVSFSRVYYADGPRAVSVRRIPFPAVPDWRAAKQEIAEGGNGWMAGTVSRWIPPTEVRGEPTGYYGFIRSDQGTEYFFHGAGVIPGDPREEHRLRVFFLPGTKVYFLPEEFAERPRAETVFCEI